MDSAAAAAIAVAAATAVLVVVTGYYAYQTRNTVEELRLQRIESAQRETERQRGEVAVLRHNLSGELRQILAIIEGQGGTGRNFMTLPTRAWYETFAKPDALSRDLRDKLFHVYGEIERMNALTNMMIAGRTGRPRTGPTTGADSNLGLELHGLRGLVTPEIRESLTMLEALPEPL